VDALWKTETSIVGRESQNQGKCHKKTANDFIGVHFICGFGCLTFCTATAPSASKVREMSSRCGSHCGGHVSLSKSCTEEERVTHLLACYAEVFNMIKLQRQGAVFIVVAYWTFF